MNARIARRFGSVAGSTLLAAVVLSACGSSTSTRAAPPSPRTSTATTVLASLPALRRWIASEAPRIGVLHTDVVAMSSGMGANNPGTTGSVCHAMSIGAGQDLTRTAPVAAVETHWQAMLYDFQAIAAVCLQAVTHGADAQLASSLNTDIGDATTEMGKLNAAELAATIGQAAK